MGFSEMKMVKSDWKSCLRPWVLSDLLFIMFQRNDIPTYDQSPAIHLWNVSGRWVRRPEQNPYGPRVQVEDKKGNLDPFLELDPDYLEKQEM